jgi:acyl-CoA synthetase (AMP-forming)/AMP-acid ligase II
VVSLREGSDTTEAAILSFAAERVAGFKKPRTLAIWPDLPKSPAGKILRREIRHRERGTAG